MQPAPAREPEHDPWPQPRVASGRHRRLWCPPPQHKPFLSLLFPEWTISVPPLFLRRCGLSTQVTQGGQTGSEALLGREALWEQAPRFALRTVGVLPGEVFWVQGRSLLRLDTGGRETLPRPEERQEDVISSVVWRQSTGTPVWQEVHFPDREDSAALPPDPEPWGPFSWDSAFPALGAPFWLSARGRTCEHPWDCVTGILVHFYP